VFVSSNFSTASAAESAIYSTFIIKIKNIALHDMTLGISLPLQEKCLRHQKIRSLLLPSIIQMLYVISSWMFASPTSRTKMNGREVTRLIPTLQNGSPGVPRLGVFHPAYTKAWHDNQIRTAAQRTVFHGCSNLAG